MNSVQRAFELTMFYEGGSWSALAGDFDGAGLSLGCFQFNAKSGTLRPLLQRTIAYLGDKVKTIVQNDDLYVLKTKLASDSVFLPWCRSLNDSSHHIKAPWAAYFKTIASTPECQRAQMEASASYVNGAKADMTRFHYKSDRAYCLLFDIHIQQGSVQSEALQYYNSSVKSTMKEPQLLEIMARGTAKAANDRWEADVLSRKLTIARGSGIVHNAFVNVDQKFGVNDNLAIFS